MGYFNDLNQDYAWVKCGMIFPFADYVDRYVIVRSLEFGFDSWNIKRPLCLREFMLDLGFRSSLN